MFPGEAGGASSGVPLPQEQPAEGSTGRNGSTEDTVVLRPVARRRRRISRGRAAAVTGTALAVAGCAVLAAALVLPRGPYRVDLDGRGAVPSADATPTRERAGGSASPTAPPPISPASAPAAQSATAPPTAAGAVGAADVPADPSALLPAPADGEMRAPASAAPAGQGAQADSEGRGAGEADGSAGDDRSSGSPVLREGDSGPEVAELQHRLLQLERRPYRGGVDGAYDREVRKGVARFQEWYGVRGDPRGVYGPHTRARLEGMTEEP